MAGAVVILVCTLLNLSGVRNVGILVCADGGGFPGAVLIGLGPVVLVGLAIFDSLHQHVHYLGFTLNHLALSGTIALLGVLQYWLAAHRE